MITAAIWLAWASVIWISIQASIALWDKPVFVPGIWLIGVLLATAAAILATIGVNHG